MVVPDEYALCPKEYRGQADDKYLDCEIAAGQVYCTLLAELHEAKDFRSVYLTLQPMGLAVLALLANSALATLCAAQLLSHNSKNRPSSSARKRFALLLSRSVACLLTLLSFLAVLLVWRFGLFNYFSVVMLLSVAIAQFLAMACTHLTLSSLLFLAVLHPLFYRTRVSMGRCWTLIGLIWMLAIGASVPFGVLGATLFYPESAPIPCPFNQCKWPVSLCLVLLLSLAYLLTIGCHLAMLCRMRTMHMGRVEPRRCQSKESTPSNSSLSDVRAMNRLTLNLVVFSLCKVPFLLIAVFGLAKLDTLQQLGLGQKSPCKTFLHGQMFYNVELLSCMAAVVWLTGMLFDPAIDICLDPRFRELLRRSLRVLGRSLHKGRKRFCCCY